MYFLISIQGVGLYFSTRQKISGPQKKKERNNSKVNYLSHYLKNWMINLKLR